uniref:EF-hand domain-containing protein n=1 Tax=Rhabditophanes sp. KR3021 TaxID=114890 RepID=A0AC35U200_9BILA
MYNKYNGPAINESEIDPHEMDRDLTHGDYLDSGEQKEVKNKEEISLKFKRDQSKTEMPLKDGSSVLEANDQIETNARDNTDQGKDQNADVFQIFEKLAKMESTTEQPFNEKFFIVDYDMNEDKINSKDINFGKIDLSAQDSFTDQEKLAAEKADEDSFTSELLTDKSINFDKATPKIPVTTSEDSKTVITDETTKTLSDTKSSGDIKLSSDVNASTDIKTTTDIQSTTDIKTTIGSFIVDSDINAEQPKNTKRPNMHSGEVHVSEDVLLAQNKQDDIPLKKVVVDSETTKIGEDVNVTKKPADVIELKNEEPVQVSTTTETIKSTVKSNIESTTASIQETASNTEVVTDAILNIESTTETADTTQHGETSQNSDTGNVHHLIDETTTSTIITSRISYTSYSLYTNIIMSFAIFIVVLVALYAFKK